jgi:hypothetical protein
MKIRNLELLQTKVYQDTLTNDPSGYSNTPPTARFPRNQWVFYASIVYYKSQSETAQVVSRCKIPVDSWGIRHSMSENFTVFTTVPNYRRSSIIHSSSLNMLLICLLKLRAPYRRISLLPGYTSRSWGQVYDQDPDPD